MAVLSEEAKVFIVQRLAMYDTPSQVSEAVKEHLGVEVSRQHVQVYDPTVGKKPSRKWVQLFEEYRKIFRESVDVIPIANKSVRVHRLQRMAAAAELKKNYPLAAQLLEQVAKELGEAYTNKRVLTGANGTALIPPSAISVTLVKAGESNG